MHTVARVAQLEIQRSHYPGLLLVISRFTGAGLFCSCCQPRSASLAIECKGKRSEIELAGFSETETRYDRVVVARVEPAGGMLNSAALFDRKKFTNKRKWVLLEHGGLMTLLVVASGVLKNISLLA